MVDLLISFSFISNLSIFPLNEVFKIKKDVESVLRNVKLYKCNFLLLHHFLHLILNPTKISERTLFNIL